MLSGFLAILSGQHSTLIQ